MKHPLSASRALGPHWWLLHKPISTATGQNALDPIRRSTRPFSQCHESTVTHMYVRQARCRRLRQLKISPEHQPPCFHNPSLNCPLKSSHCPRTPCTRSQLAVGMGHRWPTTSLCTWSWTAQPCPLLTHVRLWAAVFPLPSELSSCTGDPECLPI